MSEFGGVEAPKRFYKSAGVERGEHGWRVVLDGRPVRTPAKAMFEAPNEALAALVAAEWDAQGETVEAASMPTLRLANVAIDRTPAARADMAVEIAHYAETDLLCHLADDPPALQARQEEVWRPLRDWAGEALGVVLVPVEGVVPSVQPPASLDAVRRHAETLDDFRLTGLAHATGLLGSAVLGLAVETGRLDADDAMEAALIDEIFQAERWGWDSEATARLENLRGEAAAVGRWFKALSSD